MPHVPQRQFALHLDIPNSRLYDRADIASTCRVGTEYAISYFQVDYQKLANQAVANKNSDGNAPTHLSADFVLAGPRVVLSEEAFRRHLLELLRIARESGLSLDIGTEGP